MATEPIIGQIFAYNRDNGRYIAAWSPYSNEEPPTAYEVWNHLRACFPIVLVHPDGTLHDQYPKGDSK